MSPERLSRLSRLFDQAVDLDAAAREAFLASSCGEDAALTAELNALLHRHDTIQHKKTRSPLEWLAAEADPLQSDALLVPGQTIGAWEIEGEIGHGGMGHVFRARRREGGFDQEVAIKVVRRDRLNPALLKRFSTERTVLAALDHPGISRLIDASTLPDGTPYVVMEFVHGSFLIEHCNAAQLDIRQRLDLFRHVLAAVAHAHRNLIVHRDIKNHNVLVTPDGVPKLLDFGIAKPLADSAEPGTGTAERFFTPANAAPEQLKGEATTVGCDVYALGVLLYELLADQPPFDFEGLGAGAIERLITSVPPPPMADAIASDAPAAPHGFTDKAQWRRALKGDLEAIVQRALRKEPGKRYLTVEQLDADIANFLTGRPVSARSTQGWYRARKFAGRHRAAVALTVASLLILSAAGAAIVWQNVALRQERDRVTHERDRAQTTASFLKSAFESADPARSAGADVRAKDILRAAEIELAGIAESQPELFVELAYTIADVETSLGLGREAASLLRRALEASANGWGAARRPQLASLRARSLIVAGDLDEAAVLLDSDSIPDSPERDLLLGWLRTQQDRIAEGVTLLHRAVQGMEGGAPDDPLATEARWRFAEAQRLNRDYQGGLDTLDAMLAWQRSTLQPQHPLIVSTRARRVAMLRQLDRLDEASTESLAVLKFTRQQYGEHSPATAAALSTYANALYSNHREAEALRVYETATSMWRETLGAEHPQTLRSEFNLAASLSEDPQRKLESEPLFEHAIRGADRAFGPTHATTLIFRSVFGNHLMNEGDFGRAAGVLLAPAAEAAVSGASATGNYARSVGRLATESGCRSAGKSPPSCRVEPAVLEWLTAGDSWPHSTD